MNRWHMTIPIPKNVREHFKPVLVIKMTFYNIVEPLNLNSFNEPLPIHLGTSRVKAYTVNSTRTAHIFENHEWWSAMKGTLIRGIPSLIKFDNTIAIRYLQWLQLQVSPLKNWIMGTPLLNWLVLRTNIFCTWIFLV